MYAIYIHLCMLYRVAGLKLFLLFLGSTEETKLNVYHADVRKGPNNV